MKKFFLLAPLAVAFACGEKKTLLLKKLLKELLKKPLKKPLKKLQSNLRFQVSGFRFKSLARETSTSFIMNDLRECICTPLWFKGFCHVLTAVDIVALALWNSSGAVLFILSQ